MKRSLVVCSVLLGSALFTTPALAQSGHAWVSGGGDDANACTRASPCRTFAGALAKTATSGVISVLDPGDYGPLNINKSITLNGNGMASLIAGAGNNAIMVNAGVNDVVNIRGISINGGSTGLNGIQFLSGRALVVENCDISQFAQSAIDFEPTASAQLFVKNTVLRGNGAGGALVKPGGGGWADATFDTVQFERNIFGLRTEARSNTIVRNSSATGNLNNGFLAITADATAADLTLESCVAANTTNGNNAVGVHAYGGGSTIRISNTTVADNDRGLLLANYGKIISSGNNRLFGNTQSSYPSTMPQY